MIMDLKVSLNFVSIISSSKSLTAKCYLNIMRILWFLHKKTRFKTLPNFQPVEMRSGEQEMTRVNDVV